MKLVRQFLGSLALMGLLVSAAYAQTGSVTGTITDGDQGFPLAGANVVLLSGSSMVTGAASAEDGSYTLSANAGTYTLRVRFVGYAEVIEEVTIASGGSLTRDIALGQGGVQLNTVVVTASRQNEKVLDAPASISVITSREMEELVAPTAVQALRNTTGVDMAQTGVDRSEVVLRGFNNAFSGSAYIMTDYRHAAVPSLGVNIHSIMPALPIDVDRVEVVRGPGSALYGAGVTAGAVHYITKSPFTHQGTTISVMGGEQSLLGAQLRHAGVAGKLGYKITGAYSQANDWELDPNNAQDLAQMYADCRLSRSDFGSDDAFFSACQTQFDDVRDTDFSKYNVNATLEYKMSDNTTIVASGGQAALNSTVLSGIGTLQAVGFGYTYGQLRVQSGNLFAQAYINKNSAGDSRVYGAFPVVDKGSMINAQIQYDMSLLSGRQKLIVGADYEQTNPDTDGTILGRYEDDDTITEYGAYAQSTTALSSAIDLTAALRADYNNIVDDWQISPRAALVFKLGGSNSVRATYNRSFSSPGTNSNFLDIVAQDAFNFGPSVRARGAGQGLTWARNPAFAAIAGTDLVMSTFIGCPTVGTPTTAPTCGANSPAGLDLSTIYGSVYAGLAAESNADLAQTLFAAGVGIRDPGTGALIAPLPEANVAGLKALLSPAGGTTVQGFTRGSMVIPDLGGGAPKLVTDLTDIGPLQQTTVSSYEVGYKGVFNDKVLFTVDAYYNQAQNFIGPLLVESPLVYVPTLAQDLTAAIAQGISGNATLMGQLGALGLPAANVAGLLVSLASGGLPDASTPIGIVEAVENASDEALWPELMLSYRNFGQVEYYGVDAAVEVLLNDQISVFGNVSWVSDDFFDNEELDEAGTDLSLALNAPTFKYKVGATYRTGAISANVAFRSVNDFAIASGPYASDNPATSEIERLPGYSLLDVGVGYDLSNMVSGLRVDLAVNNALDNMHREFIGAPMMGRMASLRLTANF